MGGKTHPRLVSLIISDINLVIEWEFFLFLIVIKITNNVLPSSVKKKAYNAIIG
jgi:hypothetical protein